MIDPFFYLYKMCYYKNMASFFFISNYCLVLVVVVVVVFVVVVCGAVISLWPHESFDKRAEHREYLFNNNEEWNETCERITLLKQ